MNEMQSVDANLLLALDALLHEGSVTAAARRMNVTAPAMSHTLARLRAALGDPLFVRSGNRLVPTPRAVALRDRVGRAAGEVTSLLAPEKPLDVATLERAFVIRASGLGRHRRAVASDRLLDTHHERRRSPPQSWLPARGGAPSGDSRLPST
jgi:DNA-binding transcriptional LysR family regulator